MGGRRRRRSPSPPFLLASLLAPQGALAAPILPFLYPPSSFALPPDPSPSSSASSSSSRPPRQSRSKRTRRTPHDETSPTAEKIAFKYRPGHDGRFSPECWSLLGQSNCARNREHHDETEGNVLAEDAVIVDAPLAVDAAATNTTASSTTPTTTTTTSVTTSSSTSTVKPYTMAFEVTNIPPGWQKSSRTHFYSKNVVIGFSVSLAVLIIATIVGCVIWRIKVARSRRDAEKALKRKKAQIARDYRSRSGHPYASDSDEDDDARTQRTDERSSLGETTRQRGLRRRRRNTRAPDDDPTAEVSSEKTESVSSRSRPWSKKWKLVRRPKWARIPTGRKVEAEKEEEGDHMRANEDQPLPDLAEPALSIALRIPLPISPPPSPTSLTAPLPTPPSPPPPPPPPPPLILVTSTEVSPPAYRRRNFRNVLGRRPSTAPTSTTTVAPTSIATEKQREAEGDVPEEYMYLAGVPPVEAAQERRVEIEESLEEEVDHEDDIVEEEEAPVPMVPREAVSAHLATDDKTALARLREGGSAPEDHLPSEGPSVPTWTEEEDDEIEYEEMDLQPQDEKSASGSGLREASSLFPALPPITSAHLFVPGGEVSPPMYPVESSSRALPSDEKTPSSPPSVPSAPPEETAIVAPSAPPLAEEDLAMMVPSAPPADHD